MMTLERDGSMLKNERNDQAKETIDLPAILVLYDGDLIDRAFDVIFDRLGHCIIELRIRAETARGDLFA